MKLTKQNLVEDESLSNHAVVAIRCTDCPLTEKRACFGIAVGMGGGVAGKCEHLTESDEPECGHPDARG